MEAMNEKVLQYRKYLEKYLERTPNETKIIHVLHKLDKLPITLEHLQETGIGKVVNSYRKHESDIGDRAKSLIIKWKQLVPTEDDTKPSRQVKSETSHGHAPSIKIETVSETEYTAAVQSESMRAPYMAKSPAEKYESSERKTKRESSSADQAKKALLIDSYIKKEGSPSVPKTTGSTSSKTEKYSSSRHSEKHNHSSHTKKIKVEPDVNGDITNNHSPVIKCEKDADDACASSPLPGVKTERVKSEPREEKLSKSTNRDGERERKHHSSHKSSHKSSGEASRSHSRSKSKRDGKDHEKGDGKSSSSHKSRDEKPSKSSHGDHHGHRHSSSSKSHRDRSSDKSRDRKSESKSSSKVVAPNSVEPQASEKPPQLTNSFIDFDDLPVNDKPVDEDEELSAIANFGLEEEKGVSLSDFELEEDGGSSSKKVKFDEKVGKTEDGEVDEENAGFSFEDFLTYDVKPKSVKKAKVKSTSSKQPQTSPSKSLSVGKNAKTSSSGNRSHSKSSSSREAGGSSATPSGKDKSKHHKSSSSHHKSSSSSNHIKSSSSQHTSSAGHHKSESVKPSSSSGRPTKDGGVGSLKRKAPEALSIPPPPSKQIRLSHDDIMASLPAISPDYKPLPRIPLPSSSPEAFQDMETTLSNLKQKSRTAVYSGRKQTFIPTLPTLYDACLRVLKDNVDNLDYVGGVPYDILKPVLDTCTSSQLYTIEDSNPQFVGETEELWQKHCLRDFSKYKPSEFEGWRELYLRLHDEREAKLTRLTANISASMKAKAMPVKKTKLAYVDVTAKAPRDVRRNQMRYGTAGPKSSTDPLSHLSSHGGKKDRPRAPIPRGPPMEREERPRKEVKMVAPMMAKTIKFMKKLNRR